MNNIEKFEKLKELSRLKGEYHKREIVNLITFDTGDIEDQSSNSILNWISVGKSGFDLYRKIKSLIR